ncbi:MAG: CBS domain-containing protein, partial [Acidobacteriota bacterium]
HINADADGLASLVALWLLEGPLEIVLPGAMEPSTRRIWKDLAEGLPPITPIRSLMSRLAREPLERMLVVDTSKRERLGELAKLIDEAGEVQAWDTHTAADADLPRVELPAACACVSTLILRLMEDGKQPTPVQAGLFLVGIHMDSKHLTVPETTDIDYRAAAQCLAWGADPAWAGKYLPQGFTARQLALMETMSRSVVFVRSAVRQVALLTLELDVYEPDLSTLLGQLREAEGWPAAFLIASLEGRMYVMGRSEGAVDVGEILRAIGGGGHPGAASAVLQGVTMAGALATLRQAIEERLERHWTCGDLAVRPFISLPADGPIREAADLLHNHRINALPLTEGQGDDVEFVGLVSRQEVDAAMRHGMADRPSIEISARAPGWVSPDAPLAEARTQMLGGAGRLLLVGEPPHDARGILTRTTILMAGTGDPPLAPPRRAPNREVVLAMARESLGEAWPWVERLGRLAGEMQMSLHLVGGCVRDIFLGQPCRDVDLVVEGSAPQLAREAERRFGGRAHVHDAFATAKWTSPDDRTIDLATARSEYYESPASLPRVLHAELRRDLYRRDFTINAMAITVDPPEAGLLRDPYNGFDDIRHGLLRVLHGLSFHDDPTRAWRAARLAARFDFRLSPHTEGLLRASLRSGAFEKLGIERLGHEIERILDEREVDQAFRLLREWDLLDKVHPEFQADRAFLDRLTAVQNALHEMQGMTGGKADGEPMPRQSDVLWVVVAGAIPASHRRRLIKLVAGEKRRRDRFVYAPKRVSTALSKLARAQRAAFAARALEELDLVELIVALGIADSEPSKNWVRWWQREGRGIETALSGDRLIELGAKPGPALGRALRAAQDAAWNGRSEVEQLAAARRELMRPARR